MAVIAAMVRMWHSTLKLRGSDIAVSESGEQPLCSANMLCLTPGIVTGGGLKPPGQKILILHRDSSHTDKFFTKI